MIPGSREGSLKDSYLLLKFLKLHRHSKPDQYILCSYTVILFWWSAWFYLKLIRCPFLGKTDFLLFHSLWRSSSSPSHFTTPRPLPTQTHIHFWRLPVWSRLSGGEVELGQAMCLQTNICLFCFIFLSEQGILWARCGSVILKLVN